MPTFRITAPDGSVYRVTAPDGATEQEALARVKQQYSAATAEAPANPTDGMSGASKFFAGAGKAFVDVGRGARQLLAPIADANASVYAKQRGLQYGGNENQQAIDQEIASSRQLDAPLMKTGAGVAGNVVGNIAATAPTAFIPGANTYLGAGLIGGGVGALQPVGQGEDRSKNVALGTAGGLASKWVGDRITNLFPKQQPAGAQANAAASATSTPGVASAQSTVTANPSVSIKGGGVSFGEVGPDPSAGLSKAQKAALEAGKKLGMKTTPGQETGSRALQQLEAKMESQPWSSGPINAIKASNAKTLARVAAKAIGQDSNELSSEVLSAADEAIGAGFDIGRNAVARPIEPSKFVEYISKVNDDFEGLLPDGKTVGQHPLVQRLFRYAETGQATGEQLGGLTSKLGRAAYKEMTGASGDREMGQALYQVKDYVDDLIESGLSGQDLAKYQAARGQYRTLTLLLKPGVVNSKTGTVSPQAFANVLKKADKAGYVFGRNKSDLYAATAFGDAFRPIVGDSGTATRMPFGNALEAAASIPVNIASRLYTSSPGIKLALGAQAAGQSAQQAASPLMTPIAPYLPKYLPGVGGLLGTYLGK